MLLFHHCCSHFESGVLGLDIFQGGLSNLVQGSVVLILSELNEGKLVLKKHYMHYVVSTSELQFLTPFERKGKGSSPEP